MSMKNNIITCIINNIFGDILTASAEFFHNNNDNNNNLWKIMLIIIIITTAENGMIMQTKKMKRDKWFCFVSSKKRGFARPHLNLILFIFLRLFESGGRIAFFLFDPFSAKLHHSHSKINKNNHRCCFFLWFLISGLSFNIPFANTDGNHLCLAGRAVKINILRICKPNATDEINCVMPF